MKRPQFSLRLMFVIVALLGVWLGLEVRNVRRRADVLKWLDERRPVYRETTITVFEQNEYKRWYYRIDDANLSWVRRFLGDHRVSSVDYPTEAKSEELDRVKAAFPEADFRTWLDPFF